MNNTGNTILVSEDIWRGMTETLCLVCIPGLREPKRSGMCDHIADTATELDWKDG